MTRPHRTALAALAGLLLPVTALAGDDLDKLLNAIPDAQIEQTKPVEEEQPPAEVPLPEYVKQVRAQIQAAWAPKIKVLKKNPKAKFTMLVKVDADGGLAGFSVMEPSGVKAFDQSVLAAIDGCAKPLPRPPADLVGTAGQGLVIEFTAKQYAKR